VASSLLGCSWGSFSAGRSACPLFHESEWEGSGILALILEAVYLGAMAWWLRHRARCERAPAEAFPPVAPSDRTQRTRATTSA
jgi:hypothetical protein